MAYKPPMHGKDHRPPKYGTAPGPGGGSDPVDGMLWLPSGAETDGQVLARDSTATYGIKWATASGGSTSQPMSPGLVVAHRENTKRYPGGVRVVSLESWAWDATATDDIGLARRQVKHDQTAADFASASDSIVATTEDWGLIPGTAYRIYIGFKVDSAVAATGHIVLEAGGTESDLATNGSQTVRFGMATLPTTRTFSAGQTITIRMYHTTASAGYIVLDQLYFFPTGTVYDETVGTGFYGDRDASILVQVTATSNLANAGVTEPSDSTFFDDLTGITDTQQIKWLWDSSMRITAWSGSFDSEVVGGDVLVAEYGSVDFERRNARHVYAQARVKKDSNEGNTGIKGGHLTLLNAGGRHETTPVWSTNVGWYYMGAFYYYFGPDQWIAWRNTDYAGGNDSPWSTSIDGSLCDDVRIGRTIWQSSVLDDH
jgi:hypothetical protein